jgi:hypothetical protein
MTWHGLRCAATVLVVVAVASPAVSLSPSFDDEQKCSGEWRGVWRVGNSVGDVALTMTTLVPGEFNLIRSHLVLTNSPEFPDPISGVVDTTFGVRLQVVGVNGWHLEGTLRFEDQDQVLEGDVNVMQGNDSSTSSIVAIKLRRR